MLKCPCQGCRALNGGTEGPKGRLVQQYLTPGADGAEAFPPKGTLLLKQLIKKKGHKLEESLQ